MKKSFRFITFSNKEPPLIFSVRFLLSILCFCLNAIHYMQRVNLSVAIVSMVDNKNCFYAVKFVDNSSAVYEEFNSDFCKVKLSKI